MGTTTTWNSRDCTESRNSSNGGKILILIAVLIVVFALGVVTSEHALKHDEASTIRNCLDKNGPYMIMKNMNEPTWYLLCQIDKNHWGLQAVSKNGVEKTAFSPGDGSHQALMNYLNKIAVRFKGTVPWMH